MHKTRALTQHSHLGMHSKLDLSQPGLGCVTAGAHVNVQQDTAQSSQILYFYFTRDLNSKACVLRKCVCFAALAMGTQFGCSAALRMPIVMPSQEAIEVS